MSQRRGRGQGRPREGDMRPLVANNVERPGPQGEVMRALEAWVDAHIARPELNMGQGEWERMWGGERVWGQEVAQGWVGRARRREERRAPRGRWKEVVEGARLTGREEEVLGLVQTQRGEDGNIDWASVAREMGVARATAQVYLERAREKVKREQRRRKPTLQGDGNGIQ